MDAVQVVVDAIDPRCLVSGIVCHTLDFASTSEAELQDISIPLSFPMGALHVFCRVIVQLLTHPVLTSPRCCAADAKSMVCAGAACNVHGVACWFDVLFDGTASQRWLSTAPGLPTTHW